MADFSDFVIYADESGDHSLVKIDEGYPVFVLCLCVFNKHHYIRRVVPSVQAFKFKWFGHDAIILHENDIRKKRPPFEFLNNQTVNASFKEDVAKILRAASISLVASVIDKRRLKGEHLFQDNPYHIALSACVEKTYEFLKRKGQSDKIVHFIFECRGKREDKELELEFRRIADGQNRFQIKLPNFEIRMVDKRANSTGMQLADLTARPIGLRVLRPHQANSMFDIIKRKLIKFPRDKRGSDRIRVLP